MAIIDTTNVTNSSMLLKSRLNKNMSKDNHYINNLQAKRDQDWEFRYNVVGIEEEKEKQKQLEEEEYQKYLNGEEGEEDND